MITERQSIETFSTAGLSVAVKRTILASVLSIFDIVVTIFVIGHMRYLYGPPFSTLQATAILIGGFAVLYFTLAHVWFKVYRSYQRQASQASYGLRKLLM